MNKILNKTTANELPVILETSAELAEYLNVEEVVLVREDKLPDGGGKKRRSLVDYTDSIKKNQVLHVLSYVGSHTAYTLAKTLKNNKVILYGVTYPGGHYGKTMQEKLAAMPNIKQTVGGKFTQTFKFYTNNFLYKISNLKLHLKLDQRNVFSDKTTNAIQAKYHKQNDIENKKGNNPETNKEANQKNNQDEKNIIATDVFMKPGGSLGRDLQYERAASFVEEKIGNQHTHYAAVASGDMVTALQKNFPNAFGILTQPLLIRLVKFFKLKNAKSLFAIPVEQRENIMYEIAQKTGNLWDPVFMGSVFAYLKKQNSLPKKICIWISCPTGISWQVKTITKINLTTDI